MSASGSSSPTNETGHDAALAAEQQWLRAAYRHLEVMQARTASAVQATDRAVSEENTADARVAQWHLRRRQEGLAAGAGPLSFGKISEEGYVSEPGDVWYVGRRHIEDAEGQPVVVDWRAPVSAAFYRATSIDPCGLVHRRRFSIEGDQLVAIFDEDLTDPEDSGSGGLPDPLLAELDRSRSGQMRDIVSTIASEQDIIIRADREELLLVQGGPGTGKTAVGLHRAAFLLFRYRLEFAESRVLVVGPNRLFLAYIAEVLPSLGETSVVQTTAPGLLGGKYPVRTTEAQDVATLKGDPRMVEVLANFLDAKIRVPSDGLEVRSGITIVRFSSDDVAELQATARGRNLALNDAREVFRKVVIQEAWRRHSQRADVDPAGQSSFVGAIRSDPQFKKDIDRLWPALSVPVVIRELYSSVRKRASAATDILSKDEQALLKRSAARKVGEEQWTEADMGLLDEATALISGVPTTYGHVVLDEAQDQSHMALRMLGRRSRGHSMTILGDLAQATSPAAVGSWEATIEALTSGESKAVTRIAELTVGYRVPSSILDVANRLLPHVAPEVTPARSVRPGGAPPLIIRCAPADKGETTVAEILALQQPDAEGAPVPASLAVVAVEQDLDLVQRALAAHGIAHDRVGRAGLPGAGAVALVDPERVKGLEFDAVIVVEPAAIMAVGSATTELSSALGGRLLFVSLTRAVQHLGLVHSMDLPHQLGLEDLASSP